MCGGPSLPQCSLFWENGHLSTGGKVGIALSCLVVVSLLLLVVYIYIKRSRNDYDFAPPHDLMCKYDSREVQVHLLSVVLISYHIAFRDICWRAVSSAMLPHLNFIFEVNYPMHILV